MTVWIVAIAVIVVALLLVAVRVPIFVALGLPALLGTMVLEGSGTLVTVGLQLISPFNNFSFLALLVWVGTAAVTIESGLMERWFSALYVLAGRQVTPARRSAWAWSFHGLPLTVVALILVAGMRGMVDNHFLLLQMLVILFVVGGIAAVVSLGSAPKISQMTLKKMKSQDGESWKTTAKATAEVTEEGRTKRSASKGDAVKTLALPGILGLGLLVAILALPVGIDDLAGVVFVAVLVAGFLQGSRPGWLAEAGWRAVAILGYLASVVAGGWLLAGFLERTQLLPSTAVTNGGAVLLVLLGTLVTAATIGVILGPEVGAILAVAVFSGFFAAPFGADAAQLVAASILTSMLVVASVIGGILARVLPPRDEPYPLTATPIMA